MARLPYGSWPSAITADLLVAHAVSIGEIAIGTADVSWSELRPQEGGRVAIVRHRAGGESVDVLPADFSARTRVHEYGGGAWWLHDDALFAANWSDQRLYRIDADSVPIALTPEPATPGGARYADGCVTPDGRWVVCVRELHEREVVRNEIAAVRAHDGGEPVVLVSGPDFVSFPRVSPDGRRLCWTQWDDPHMPWDQTELCVAELAEDADGIRIGPSRVVAGGDDESIFQPTWSGADDLLFVSWYSVGVRVVDIRDPSAPRELAAWLPPDGVPPNAVRTPFVEGPLIWGIAVEGDLVVASEMNNGLYVLRLAQ